MMVLNNSFHAFLQSTTMVYAKIGNKVKIKEITNEERCLGIDIDIIANPVDSNFA